MVQHQHKDANRSWYTDVSQRFGFKMETEAAARRFPQAYYKYVEESDSVASCKDEATTNVYA